MQFSLDRKRRSHKQNQCSASDSVGLIFTRSYRFTLLITTPTTTPSLVKTSLKELVHHRSSQVAFVGHSLAAILLKIVYFDCALTMNANALGHVKMSFIYKI